MWNGTKIRVTLFRMHCPRRRSWRYLQTRKRRRRRWSYPITSFPSPSAKLTGYKIDIKSETQAKDAPGFRYEDYLDDEYEDGEYEDGYEESYEEGYEEEYAEDDYEGSVEESSEEMLEENASEEVYDE